MRVFLQKGRVKKPAMTTMILPADALAVLNASRNEPAPASEPRESPVSPVENANPTLSEDEWEPDVDTDPVELNPVGVADPEMATLEDAELEVLELEEHANMDEMLSPSPKLTLVPNRDKFSEIKGVGASTEQQLWAAGFETYADLQADPKRVYQVVGERRGRTILEAIAAMGD